jgi:hypothetical protein
MKTLVPIFFGKENSTQPKIIVVREFQSEDRNHENELTFNEKEPWDYVIDSEQGLFRCKEGKFVFTSLKMANFFAAHIEAVGINRNKVFDVFNCLIDLKYYNFDLFSETIFDFLVLEPLLCDLSLHTTNVWWEKELETIERKNLLGPGREKYDYNPLIDWRLTELAYYERQSGFNWQEYLDKKEEYLDINDVEANEAFEGFRSNKNFVNLLRFVETEFQILRHWQKTILRFILMEFNRVRMHSDNEDGILENFNINKSVWPSILLSMTFVKGKMTTAEYVRRLLQIHNLIPTTRAVKSDSESLVNWGINPELYQKLYTELINYLMPISELITLEKEEEFREISFSYEKELNNINLPTESRLAIRSATRNLLAEEDFSTHSDYSQIVLLAGKAVEVYLIETLFRNWKFGYKKTSFIELSEVTLSSKAKNLFLFVSKTPGFITLGEMALIFKLKGGKTEKKVRLLSDFFDFVAESGFSKIFQPKMGEMLTSINDLRNKAAHKEAFNRKEAEDALENAISYISSLNHD